MVSKFEPFRTFAYLHIFSPAHSFIHSQSSPKWQFAPRGKFGAE